VNPVLSFAIMLIGIYGVVFSRNIIKSIICFAVTETSLILLFLNLGYIDGGSIPIVSSSEVPMVDPLPQALMITAIVIGASVTALAFMTSIKIFHHFGTLEWKGLFIEKE
jgi:multicomponent Na+:H+ antiporter subunit C